MIMGLSGFSIVSTWQAEIACDAFLMKILAVVLSINQVFLGVIIKVTEVLSVSWPGIASEPFLA